MRDLLAFLRIFSFANFIVWLVVNALSWMFAAIYFDSFSIEIKQFFFPHYLFFFGLTARSILLTSLFFTAIAIMSFLPDNFLPLYAVLMLLGGIIVGTVLYDLSASGLIIRDMAGLFLMSLVSNIAIQENSW